MQEEAAPWAPAQQPVAEAGPVRFAGVALGAASTAIGEGARYRFADLSEIPADPKRFHDADYQPTLRRMVVAVMDVEAPVREDVLAQRIARAHGWLRTGGKIRERIQLHLKAFERTTEDVGDFLWKPGTRADTHPYRPPLDAESRRSVTEIPLAELAGLVREHPTLRDESDPALSLARLIGVERLAATSRARLDEAVRYGVEGGDEA